VILKISHKQEEASENWQKCDQKTCGDHLRFYNGRKHYLLGNDHHDRKLRLKTIPIPERDGNAVAKRV
jgi:hypothetical protein